MAETKQRNKILRFWAVKLFWRNKHCKKWQSNHHKAKKKSKLNLKILSEIFFLSLPCMMRHNTRQSAVGGWSWSLSFIRACPNKPARLVFGHGNNYLERARHSLQDFLSPQIGSWGQAWTTQQEQRLQSNTVFPPLLPQGACWLPRKKPHILFILRCELFTFRDIYVQRPLFWNYMFVSASFFFSLLCFWQYKLWYEWCNAITRLSLCCL